MESNILEKSQMKKIFENETPVKKYSKGDIIYYQGDKASCFYYLKRGRVKVYMTSPDGMEKTLSTASSGEILGEAAFFDNMPPSQNYFLTIDRYFIECNIPAKNCIYSMFLPYYMERVQWETEKRIFCFLVLID